mmetsp:Transcript_114177/g.368877  ORF Transcript_114177/g.368877 Transcript_114177/m.368877 type:complete len:461 (-) Transcript_114177:247-1629(-)
MPRSASISWPVGVACIGACMVVAPLFVAPSHSSTPPRSSLRRSDAAPEMDGGIEPTAANTITPVAGLALVGAAVLVARSMSSNSRTQAPKVARHFFGGGSTPAYKSFDPATEAGVQDPVGFWDPLGLAADKDEATFKRRRAVEIKHGRVCMYATIGYIVPEYFKFPGYLSPSLDLKFEDVPNGLAAISKVPLLGWLQILFFAGAIETSGFFSGSSTAIGFMKDSTEDSEPGNYGVGFPNFIGKVDDAEARASKLNAELANGRLAMVAIIGMFFQDGLTGSAWGDWALYTASPLRAAEDAPPPPPPFAPAEQVGAMAPLGFFDPLGFTKVGDEEGFRNLRTAELKHGRVAMMAALGGVAQHYIKFPGFESVPSGVAAVATPPGTYGFVALFLLSGALELGVWTQDPNKEVGDFGDPLGLGMYDEETRNKEINNGRFAMFAAIGIISAELLTGKDAIQQFGL